MKGPARVWGHQTCASRAWVVSDQDSSRTGVLTCLASSIGVASDCLLLVCGLAEDPHLVAAGTA